MEERKTRPISKRTKEILSGDLLTPIKLSDLGTKDDPCFGKLYDLSTAECKMCGDSELCCLATAAHLGKTRKELEAENNYKDLDSLVDKSGAKKYYRGLKRRGKTRKEIITALQNKYELSLKEARTLYREFKSNK